MEMEASPSRSPEQVVARRLWRIVRIVILMLRKGIAKSKLSVDFNLNLLLKRGKLAATKAIVTLHGLHRSAQNDDAVYAPRDYEFSCSNSPAFFHVIKRSSKQRCSTRFPHYDVDVQKVLEILNNNNNNNNKFEASSPLPGFGKSPIGKKLIRITDSPFPLKNEEEAAGDNQVDVAAEEFIKRFYKDLNLQKNIDSPYHYNFWDR